MTGKPARDDKRFLPLAIVVLLLAIVLPVLYVLSIGPAFWLALHGKLDEAAYAAFYSPLFWVANHFGPLWQFIDWYTDLWR